MSSDICFEQIRDNYWFGQYDDFRVVMMRDCGFINATKLCRNGGKRFDHWLANDTSKSLINALLEQLRHQAPEFTSTIKAEADLHYGDANVGIPGAVCKYIQTANITEADKLISGTYLVSEGMVWINAGIMWE